MDVVNRKGVPTLQYYLPVKQDLSALSFNPVCHLLRIYTLPSAVNLDLLMLHILNHIGRASCNMYVSVITDHHSAVSQVSLLSIIDLNPTDLTRIYSTLCFVEQQAKQLRIETPCITFHQPLWQKAVDIITATKMNMVCRLGGFHIRVE